MEMPIFIEFEEAAELEAMEQKLTEADRNRQLLEEFEQYLRSQGLSLHPVTVCRDDVASYLKYLASEGKTALEGASHHHLQEYLGSYYIRRCLWSTPKSLKRSAVSLKKFYHFMQYKNDLSLETYTQLKKFLKANIGTWQEVCSLWNSRDYDLSEDPAHLLPYFGLE